MSLIVAAYREEAVIAAKVANALALDWPRERLEVIVAVDGGAEPGADATAERARAAGADLVLELPRGGKVRAQDAAVRAARGDLLAFSDANATLGAGRAAPARRGVRRSRGRLRVRPGALRLRRGHQPGGRLLALRDVAARAASRRWPRSRRGNGAIYAVRREAYVEVDPVMGHDLSFPFLMVKRGRRAVYAPDGAGDGEDGARRSRASGAASGG